MDERNAVYGKPLLSHEICIHGTYIDLSLEERYRNTRIGETAFMSSVRQHLQDKGLLERAPLYYQNSSAWQQILRKHCFEFRCSCHPHIIPLLLVVAVKGKLGVYNKAVEKHMVNLTVIRHKLCLFRLYFFNLCRYSFILSIF